VPDKRIKGEIKLDASLFQKTQKPISFGAILWIFGFMGFLYCIQVFNYEIANATYNFTLVRASK